MVEVFLPQNVQFIYEHALANIEFAEAFAATNVRVDEAYPWHFTMHLNGNAQDVIKRSAYAGTVDDVQTVYGQLILPRYQGGDFNRTRSVNQYLTHWIYPYKGKFHPQIIRALLNIIGMKPGCRVLDPFLGSGTTALECELLGIDFIGADISPLCATLAKVKTMAFSRLEEIRGIVDGILAGEPLHPDDLDPHSSDIPEVRDFLEIARMVTFSDSARRGRDPKRYLRKNLKNMLESIEAMARARSQFGLQFGNVEVHCGDARQLEKLGIGDCYIDGIVTSPPYSIALDYVKNDEHALAAMGLDTTAIREDFIGVRGRGAKVRLELYAEDLKRTFLEMRRVLKPNGWAIVVIGNATVNGKEWKTTDEMVDWAGEAGLALERDMLKIVYGLYGVISYEKILFFRRA